MLICEQVTVYRIRDVYAKVIFNQALALICCLSDLNISSFELLNHCNNRRSYDYRIVPDHFYGYVPLYHYAWAFWDEFVCIEYLVSNIVHLRNAFDLFSLNE